jgi:PAS domain S-box-containing protein
VDANREGSLMSLDPASDNHGIAFLEERMRSVVDHVIDGIITVDTDGCIEAFNPAAEALFGYTSAEVLGRDVNMLVPARYEGQAYCDLRRDFISQGADTGDTRREVAGLRKDGSTFPMTLAVSEFQIRGKRYFTGIVRDLSERKQLEREVHMRLDELAEADRQKNEFLAMLAHELRNPLAPMRNSLHLLKMQGANEEMTQHAREVMERQLQHLVRLVDDLLDLARIVRGHIDLRREELDIAVAVARAMEIAQPTVDAQGHVLDVTLPDPPVWVKADLMRLSQAIANLITNAAKYTVEPGRIVLRATREDGQAVIRVRDTGIGIPAGMLPRIFDLFVRGEQQQAAMQGGLGIGLTLVKRLVEMHGGSITAASGGSGQGSEFVIRLPLLTGQWSEQKGNVDGSVPAHGGRARRVLVVDDNVDAAESIAMILQLGGDEVRCVYDGVSVLDTAREWHPDAIVLDIGLPGISGYEVARQLRQQPSFQHTLLIAVTGYGQEADRRRSDEAGINHHLTKPVDPDALQRLLQRAGSGVGQRAG